MKDKKAWRHRPRWAANGMLLVLWALLTGCAGGPVMAPARTRVLRASGGGPEGSGDSSGRDVQGYDVPGRKLESQMPWEFFLGNAAHRLIAYMYGVNHPQHEVFYNTETVAGILAEARLGDVALLLPQERALRPDITNVTVRDVFEIKPGSEQGLQEGREEVLIYLRALNRAAVPGVLFQGGTDFQGEILIRFAQGQYIWRLEWQTTHPGVVQYRWTRSQQRFESAAEASNAGKWVVLSEAEMRQYGGWVGQAVEGMVSRREKLATFSGSVGVVIDVIGEGARAILTGVILGRMNSGSGGGTAGQPPAQGGGRIIPLPTRPTPPAPPAQVPAAAMGM